VFHSLSRGLCSAGGSWVRKGRAWRERQDVSFPAVFWRSCAASWPWVPTGTALLRAIERLGFGVWPPQQPGEKTQRHRGVGSPWECELVEPGCIACFSLGAACCWANITACLTEPGWPWIKYLLLLSPRTFFWVIFDLDPFPLWLAVQLQRCVTCGLQLAPPGRLCRWLRVKCAFCRRDEALQFPLSSFKLSGVPEEYSL